MHLLAIAPATKPVALCGAAVEVTGLSLRKLTQLISAYPDLVGLVAGGRLDAAALLTQAPDAALAVFSLGVVGPSRPTWWTRPITLVADGGDHDPLVEAFDRAPAGQQIEILGAIFDLTTKGSDRAIPFLKGLFAPAPAPPGPEVLPVDTTTCAPSTPPSSSV